MSGCLAWLPTTSLSTVTIAHAFGLIRTSMRGLAMIPLRKIILQAAIHDVQLKPIHIAGKANTLADDLSRFRLSKVADEFRPYRSNTTGTT